MQNKISIKIAKGGTNFRVGSTDNFIELNEEGCIWLSDDTVVFTKKSWETFIRNTKRNFPKELEKYEKEHK